MAMYNLYVLRSPYQIRARQKLSGSDWYKEETKRDLSLYKKTCPDPVEPQIKQIEKYKIYLDTERPNLPNLYARIREVCPEFDNKTNFHLYWKYSDSKLQPVSNYITYLSMIALIADINNNLYLVDREWSETWLSNMAATYIPLPEDIVLVNMIAPRQSIFTGAQEAKVNKVQSAARSEFTRTYSPPPRVDEEQKSKEDVKKGKGGKSTKDKASSPKSKGTKKK
uniref:Uncharacterized protein n=1 Tax=Graphocephala atropunctata TaxID=36148 RepID=A0A1B6KPC0_9HEMI